MDARSAALAASATRVDAYAAHKDTIRFVLSSNLNVARAVKRIAKDNAASSFKLKDMFTNLAYKLGERNLTEREMELAHSILKQHTNIVHAIFGQEAKEALTREAMKQDAAQNQRVDDENTLAVAEVVVSATQEEDDLPF